MRFKVANLGCRVNRVESDSITAKLIDSGWMATSESPDVVIVNTCTVTGEADKKTRKTVRHLLREYGQATLLVTGCAAAMTPEVYLEMSDRVRVVARDAVVDMALSLDDAQMHGLVRDCSSARFGEQFPTRVGIKIQDGCDNACTYCIVHLARGASRSVNPDDCIVEALRQYEAGAREIVLTGIDLGNYDFEGLRLDGLLDKLLQELPQARIRISSVEPPSITPDIIARIAAEQGRICRHLHLPLQSGSSKVLREMGRHYSAEDFRDLVDRIYDAIPFMSLSTDIIVGFPGETERDFRETLDMVRYCKFTKVHAFRYSRRAGTPAACRTDQVDPEVVADRAQRLREVAGQVRRAEQEKRLGTAEALLVEQLGEATSESYFMVHVDPGIPRGSMITCTLGNLDENGIFHV